MCFIIRYCIPHLSLYVYSEIWQLRANGNYINDRFFHLDVVLECLEMTILKSFSLLRKPSVSKKKCLEMCVLFRGSLTYLGLSSRLKVSHLPLKNV